MGYENSLWKNTEEDPSHEDNTITVHIPSGSDEKLEDSDSCRETGQTNSSAYQVAEVADEEKCKYVGEGVETVEELELGLADVKNLFHGLFEGLRVIEGILVAKCYQDE